MEASTVYYTDFRCPVGTSLTEKLRRPVSYTHLTLPTTPYV